MSQDSRSQKVRLHVPWLVWVFVILCLLLISWSVAWRLKYYPSLKGNALQTVYEHRIDCYNQVEGQIAHLWAESCQKESLAKGGNGIANATCALPTEIMKQLDDSRKEREISCFTLFPDPNL